jgi:hypothetical protein
MGFIGMTARQTIRFGAIQILVGVVFCLLPSLSAAQDDQHQHNAQAQPAAMDDGSWTWATDANVILGYNYQERLFADFWAWESQNWAMASGTRTLGPGRFSVQGMLSLEPWTIGRFVYAQGADGRAQRLFAFNDARERKPLGGSPQTFQTGESYLGSPLINYQHPHDLLMNAGASYQFGRGKVKYLVGADLVGSPALGPIAFMHRESARNNPQAPLTHHYLDSTHITPGVIRTGIEVGQVMFEVSGFRGEEPDEDRLDIDQPRIDSWSLRGSWRKGPWEAQFSSGHLNEPEWFDPYDVTRFTASIQYNGAVASRPLAATLAWGQNREILGALDGYLLEWDLQAASWSSIYGRAETMRKEILSLGVHPRGLPPNSHPHSISDVSALTVGYVWNLPIQMGSSLGVGADITVYKTSTDLETYFGSPRSYHVFLRWRPNRSMPAHIH